uniref:Reverse transcriptase domain-containing protein n=1 Tax=Mesocestoides corti TaxID=53468 RepID=A0A5K3EUP2_MESCO
LEFDEIQHSLTTLQNLEADYDSFIANTDTATNPKEKPPETKSRNYDNYFSTEKFRERFPRKKSYRTDDNSVSHSLARKIPKLLPRMSDSKVDSKPYKTTQETS